MKSTIVASANIGGLLCLWLDLGTHHAIRSAEPIMRYGTYAVLGVGTRQYIAAKWKRLTKRGT